MWSPPHTVAERGDMQTARIASLSRPPARVHARRERRRGPVRVLAAGGKRDGRGSETWKDGRSDTFDASGKDAILIGKGLRKTHDGERYQFRNVDISLNSGQRVAVVGPNGSGKSTLLQVLAGKDAGREDGELWVRKGITSAFLEQEPPFDEELNVLEAVYTRDTPLFRLLRRYDGMMAQVAKGEEVSENAMANILEEMDANNAWDTENKAHMALEMLGCDEFMTRKMGELSGGQRKRVALAAALIEEPDLLVLDEPTNHLSVEGVEWLENRINEMSNTAVLLVSHDRAFIDVVCPDILELDGVGGSHRHRGGYAAYLEGREARWQVEEQQRASARNTLRKEQEWMRRQPKARATKEKARIERFYNLSDRAADKGSKTKMVDLVESRQLRMGDIIVEFDQASLAFGEKKILDDFTYSFVKGDKIGLVGPNSAGKTTFLKTIMGEIALDKGWCNVGETIEFGYYSQMPEFRDATQTVVDFVREVEADAKGYVGSYGGEGGTMSAYKLLERFNFGGPKQMTRIEDLSGGEQRRLQLLSVLAKCPNFLILDEPTNDLDLDTIEALEEMLSDFDGCVIVVSHDRQFVNNLVDHIFVFDGGGQVNDWSGDYTALRQFLKTMEEEREAAKALTGNPDVNPLELTDEEIAEAKARVEDERKILKEAHNAPGVIEKIEAAIAVLEGNIENIDERLMEAGADVSKAQEIQVERDAKASKMQLYYDEWERLEEVLSRAEEIKAASEETVNA